MAIYTIGDLHLSFGTDKPMDKFGWGNHSKTLKQNWIENVKSQDTVILPGDFSWAINFEEAAQDFAFLDDLPGQKILAKGNHDYWWNTITKMEKYLAENHFSTIKFLQNNSYLVEGKIIVGTRGWMTNSWNSEENYKILKREKERLKLSIESGIKEFGEKREMLCFLHYPPFFKEKVPEEISFIEAMKQYGINHCFYGHLHGESHKEAFMGEYEGIRFELVSSDYLDFMPKLISD